MEAQTFRDAYDVLQRHAATLREQDEPNIDDLLDIVNESVAAYKVCKLRIDAVEKALEEALVGAGLEGSARGTKAAPNSAESADATPARKTVGPVNAGGFDDIDDEIPF
ncbi:exodeoxyribonuclease VII small subunit [Paucibacter soli]|uniref:exodeoxyribonuclease VII small subunit n=1 Tax=Paucibacter soli TaxID=3133433 RepID=UPI0030AD1BDF